MDIQEHRRVLLVDIAAQVDGLDIADTADTAELRFPEEVGIVGGAVQVLVDILVPVDIQEHRRVLLVDIAAQVGTPDIADKAGKDIADLVGTPDIAAEEPRDTVDIQEHRQVLPAVTLERADIVVQTEIVD